MNLNRSRNQRKTSAKEDNQLGGNAEHSLDLSNDSCRVLENLNVAGLLLFIGCILAITSRGMCDYCSIATSKWAGPIEELLCRL